MTANEAALTRQVEALAKAVAELTARVAAMERVIGRVTTGNVAMLTLPALMERTPDAVVDVRDGSVRVSSPDGVPVVVHRAELVIEEDPMLMERTGDGRGDGAR